MFTHSALINECHYLLCVGVWFAEVSSQSAGSRQCRHSWEGLLCADANWWRKEPLLPATCTALSWSDCGGVTSEVSHPGSSAEALQS